MRKSTLALLLAATIATMPGHAWSAVEVRGVKFADTYELGSQSLQLNGAGVRVKFIVDVYAASLYVPHKSRSVDELLSQAGPKSVHAVLLRDVQPDDFVGALIAGFKGNNSEAQMAKYGPALQELSRLMEAAGTVRKGSVLRMDYVPGTGTRFFIDGQRQGPEVAGDEFFQCLVRIWLGPHPVDKDLKAALLGGK